MRDSSSAFDDWQWFVRRLPPSAVGTFVAERRRDIAFAECSYAPRKRFF